MDRFVINGGVALKGEVVIGGSKNAALPLIAAMLLTPERCVLRGVPNLSDTRYMVAILQELGAEAKFEDGTVTVEAKRLRVVADYDIVRKMRASFCVFGPLLGRQRKAKVSVPGGCVIGPRPIDMHIKGFRALGAKVDIEKGLVVADAKELIGTTVFLGGRFGSTVTGTANVMMAAVLAKGTTVIECAACEPEVVDLAEFLIAMGAQIHGAGSPTLTIHGVEQLHGAEHTVIGDRVEAATFMTAAAITGGCVRLKGTRSEHLGAIIDKFRESGIRVERNGTDVVVKSDGARKPADVVTMPYPGFPTDMQAQFMTLMAVTPGISVITEKIYPERFMHVAELGRLGADISLEGPCAIVKGVPRLSGAPIMASDLRASAALILAGLVAQGKTRVNRVYHIDRGYEKIDDKLRALGARIERQKQ